MNKIFKIIWNKTTQRLEVVSELAKSQGKATASADNRIEVSSSTKRRPSFALTTLALSMLMLSSEAFAVKNYGNVTSWGSEMIWGVGNKATNDVENNNTLPIIVGVSNNAGLANARDSGSAINMFGRNNQVLTGKNVTVIGNGNSMTATQAGNTATGFIAGNNVSALNPASLGLYIGNNVTANSSPIAIGNNVYSEIGGSVIGHNAAVRARNAAAGGFLNNDAGFAVGSDIAGYGDHIFLGRGINLSSGNIANQATVNNKKSVYVGQDITAKGSKESVLMGSGITSTDDVGHYAVALGSDIMLGNGNDQTANSTAVGQHINVTAKNVVAVGSDITASAEKATAIGSGAKATNNSDVALGADSSTEGATTNLSTWTVTGDNVTARYDNSVKATSNGVVSVGSSTVRRQIKNVAAGDVSATSTDAVNGAQLYWLSTRIGDTNYVHVNSTETGNKDSANSGATGSNSVAIGPSATSKGDSGIAIGNKASKTIKALLLLVIMQLSLITMQPQLVVILLQVEATLLP